jgi:hypothetical protein
MCYSELPHIYMCSACGMNWFMCLWPYAESFGYDFAKYVAWGNEFPIPYMAAGPMWGTQQPEMYERGMMGPPAQGYSMMNGGTMGNQWQQPPGYGVNQTPGLRRVDTTFPRGSGMFFPFPFNKAWL